MYTNGEKQRMKTISSKLMKQDSSSEGPVPRTLIPALGDLQAVQLEVSWKLASAHPTVGAGSVLPTSGTNSCLAVLILSLMWEQESHCSTKPSRDAMRLLVKGRQVWIKMCWQDPKVPKGVFLPKNEQESIFNHWVHQSPSDSDF